MQFSKVSLMIASLLSAGTFASPLAPRQYVGVRANEYTLYGCRPVIFFFARATTEIGNLGYDVGPDTANGLKTAFGSTNVAVEGVDYPAIVTGTWFPGGANPRDVVELEELLDSAASKCPKSWIVVGGYSQGAALVHRAVEDRSTAVKARIAGVVTYGDIQKAQDGGRIKNFDTAKTKIICNTGDILCSGTLIVLPIHFLYKARVPEGVAFLVSAIKKARGG